jgi:ABC-type branched-subunit amino acid transport system substrate-binding protein
MDPSGWAAYAAVKIAYQAVTSAGARDPATLIGYLEQPDSRFDLGKGASLGFDAQTHELVQPLYVVGIDPSAEWGPQLSRRVGLSSLVAELPPLATGPAGTVP